MEMNICPITNLTLHTKLRHCVEAGVLNENPSYHLGFGKGIYYSFKGNKIKIKRKVRGVPRWENGVPSGLYFKEPHDVAYCSETNTLITWALAL